MLNNEKLLKININMERAKDPIIIHSKISFFFSGTLIFFVSFGLLLIFFG